MTRLARMARAAALVLGTGYALCFFSETMFWAVWRPDDEPIGRVLQWLLYSLLGYVTLAVIRHARVDDVWSLVLAGALFGWLDEGVFAMTVFGDPSMPFPFTIAWTALAWHGPISLVLGWYVLGLALRRRRIWATLGLALAFGLFWGVWAFGWLAETPPVTADPAGFLANAGISTACLALAHAAIGWGRAEGYAPSRFGPAIAGLPVLGFFALLTTPTIPIAPLVLLPLLGLLALLLVRHRRSRTPVDCVLAAFAAPVRRRNLAVLFVMPLTATIVHAVLSDNAAPQPGVHLALAAATSALGTALFVIALVKILRRRARGAAFPATTMNIGQTG